MNTSPIGMNLQELVDFSPEQAFLDLMKQSRDWVIQGPGGQQLMPASQVDANGWPLFVSPGTMAVTYMCWSSANLRYRGGRYNVVYDGHGTLRYQQMHGACQVISTSPGRDVISLDPALGGLSLAITSTDPTNHVRNIRVVQDDFVGIAVVAPWNPDFVASLRGYSCIRFMWWMHATINLPASQAVYQTTWARRPKVTDRNWAGQNGVPIELIINLCNMLGVDPWLCVSHLADDDYVTQLGAFVRTHLLPGLKVYIEHSNEVWNGGYTQAQYARQQGLAQGLDTNPTLAGAKWHSARSVHVFNLFSAAVGDPSRVVRVMGAFNDSSQLTQTLLTWHNAAASTDAVAIAPYFGFRQTLPDSTTLDQLFSMVQSQVVPLAVQQVQAQSNVTRPAGVRLIAYEGGPSFASTPSTTAAINALFDAANRDPRMGAAGRQLLDAWKTAGGQEFIWYSNCMSFSPYGRYGVLEYLAQPVATAPKYQALQAWASANPKWF